ncbi:MAG: lysylphosphatidylglycerol synthase transmembrane domain-containing protein [Ardenticatenaceae bacterium]
MPIKNLSSKVLVSLILVIGVFAGFTLYTDLQSLLAALIGFNWWMIAPVLLITLLVNLGARFVKWEYYLRVLDIRGVSWDNSLAIFLANYALILTPGKVGGFLKSYFLKQTNEVPLSRSMPIIVAERLTDGLGLVMMTMVALVGDGQREAWAAVLLVLAGMIGIIVVAQMPSVVRRVLAMGERLPLLNRFVDRLQALYDSAHELLQPIPLLWGTFLGTLARSAEGVALYFVLLGLGLENSFQLFQQSIFIAALSNIVGVLVMLPGGVGGTEGSMAGLLDYFVGLAPASATAATLIARFGSFWTAALLGGLALFVKRKVFFASPAEKFSSS